MWNRVVQILLKALAAVLPKLFSILYDRFFGPKTAKDSAPVPGKDIWHRQNKEHPGHGHPLPENEQ